jgi:hypothetical protein
MIAQRYTGSIDDDRLLAGWFGRLHLSGDWSKCFIQPPGGIGWFYAYFQREVELWYVTDEPRSEITLAGWFEPMNQGTAFFSLWVHQAYRGKRRSVQAFVELLDYGLTHKHIILGITKQENLLDAHRKMGYTIVGKIPGLWGHGQDAWLVSITRPQLEKGLYYAISQRRRQRHPSLEVPSTGSGQRTPDGSALTAAGD